MGLLSGIFGRKKTSAELDALKYEAEALYGDVEKVAEAERKRFEELQKKQLEERIAYQKRQTNLQGGGRKGLMYGGNAMGVA